MILKNKVALITGSTSGIGLGIANQLASEGANIVLNGFGELSVIEKIKTHLQEQFQIQVLYDAADMSKPDQIQKMVSRVEEKFGRLDVLVNNAGIQHVAPVEGFPLAQWDAIIAINLSSAFHTIHSALPLMRKQNWGRIINMASVHGLVASVNKSAYVAAKHGLIGLTKTVALETAKTGITCNAICPGWVLTPLVQKQIDDQAERLKISLSESKQKLLFEKQPSQEFVTPEQIGQTVSFFCSEAATQIRGATLAMDGGWLAQ
jgi:3-hydroxybutyrate dehydrogenase